MEEQRISSILWGGKWLIAACVAVGVVLAVVVTKTTPKTYEALATIEVVAGGGTPNATPNDLQLAAQGQAQTDATLIGTRSFLNAVRPGVSGGKLSASEIASRISAKAVQNTSLVQLTATGSSPAAARSLANGVSLAFVRYVRGQALTASQSLQSQIREQLALVSKQIRRLSHNPTVYAADLASLRNARASIQTQLAGIVASGIAQSGSVRLTAPASASSSPVKPRPLMNLVAGILLGLLAGVGLAWLRTRLDRGLHHASEAEAILGVPLLATVPIRRGFTENDAILSEAFDVLRANLAFVSHDRRLQALTFTSYNPQEGKTSTIMGLARAAARSGISVAVVDADVRKASLSERFGRADDVGLTQVLVGALPLDAALVEPAPGVTLLPAGATPPNPPSLLGSERMVELLEDLRGRFSLVLVDAPPVAHLADASILAGISDGVVLLGRVGVTDRSHLVDALANLRHSHTPVVGAVVLEKVSVDESYYPGRAVDADTPVALPKRKRERTVLGERP